MKFTKQNAKKVNNQIEPKNEMNPEEIAQKLTETVRKKTKDIKVNLQLKSGIPLIKQNARSIPYQLRKHVEKKLRDQNPHKTLRNCKMLKLTFSSFRFLSASKNICKESIRSRKLNISCIHVRPPMPIKEGLFNQLSMKTTSRTEKWNVCWI